MAKRVGGLILLLVGCSSPATAPDATSADAAIDAIPTTGWIRLTWQVFDGGVPWACPAAGTIGTLYAALEGQPARAFGFPCEAGAAIIPELDGQYVTWFELSNAAGAVLARTPEVEILVVPARELIEHFDIDLQGYLLTSWDLFTSEGAAIGCDAVSNGGVQVSVTPAGGGTPRVRQFACSDGTTNMRAWVSAVPVADHVVTISLLDPAEAVIARSPPRPVTIEHGNQLVELLDSPITLP